jgi:hypothetical protein
MRGGTFGAFVDNLISISTCYILSRDGKKREVSYHGLNRVPTWPSHRDTAAAVRSIIPCLAGESNAGQVRGQRVVRE